MTRSDFQNMIESYIRAYNNLDVAGMLEHLHPEVEFESIVDGKVALRLEGIDNFKLQAEEALSYFTEREQKITDLKIEGNQAEAQIAYKAVLAMDLPNGLKAGEELELKGKSVFTLKEGKIIRLQDYS
ncbi:hypothetical protein OB13_02660 [Pontibacter sp. HJ8]